MNAALEISTGLVMLAIGGEGVVRGAVGIARRLGLSELLIGLTLVGFGTSSPELITSIDAALRGSPGIAIGNVLGSNIGNCLLIFALVVIVRPIRTSPEGVSRDGAVAVAASMLLAGLALAVGELTRLLGALLIALLAVYIATVWWLERKGGPGAARHAEQSHTHDPTPGALWLSIMFALAGLGLLVFGADLLVRGAITSARAIGVSEAVIGLTVVAIGTALPELVATLAAALKGRSDVAFGSIVGSNIYNVLGILGVTALIQPVAVPDDILAMDFAVVVGSAVLLLVFARTGASVTRLEGVALLGSYVGYLAHLLSR